MKQLFFLDVNVPMYAAGQPHEYKTACVWIMEEIVEGRLKVVASAEIIQEVLYRFGALRRWEVGVRMAENLLAILPPLYPVTAEDARVTVGLFQEYGPRGVTARDCLHAAVMKNNGLTHVISADVHFGMIKGLTRIDPLDLYATAG